MRGYRRTLARRAQMDNARLAKEDRRRRTILASDLALFTRRDNIVKYFTKFGVVENAARIHNRQDGTYTRSCKVRMASVNSVAAILENARHLIDNREVGVEQYQGMAEHQWLFVKGKFRVTLRGLEINVPECDLYEKLEKAFIGCGRYSDIDLMRGDRGKLTGVAVIDFINKVSIRQALKVAREELHCEAFRSKVTPRH